MSCTKNRVTGLGSPCGLCLTSFLPTKGGGEDLGDIGEGGRGEWMDRMTNQIID